MSVIHLKVPWKKPTRRLGDVVPAILEPSEVVLPVPTVDKLNKFLTSKNKNMSTGLKKHLLNLVEKVPVPIPFKTGGQVQNKIKKVLEEFEQGKLYSSSGKKVTDRKQALAIALSEQRHYNKN